MRQPEATSALAVARQLMAPVTTSSPANPRERIATSMAAVPVTVEIVSPPPIIWAKSPSNCAMASPREICFCITARETARASAIPATGAAMENCIICLDEVNCCRFFGDPMNILSIPVYSSWISDEDVQAVGRVAAEGWISSTGAEVQKFEDDFANYLG